MYTLIIVSQSVLNVHTFVESSAKKKQTSDRDRRLREMKNHYESTFIFIEL